MGAHHDGGEPEAAGDELELFEAEPEEGDDEDDGGGAGGEEEVGQKERGQEPPLKERAKFMEVSRNTVQQCRDETEEMYAAEGRPGETPDTLDAYLEGQKKKATQQREGTFGGKGRFLFSL